MMQKNEMVTGLITEKGSNSKLFHLYMLGFSPSAVFVSATHRHLPLKISNHLATIHSVTEPPLLYMNPHFIQL